MVFFLLLLAFTRIGAALGMGTTPVGIGSFFLGSPSITESNFNQVLGLLVGPQGSPGVSGVSGANGSNGVSGLNGAPGVPGVAGLPGVVGVAGANGSNGVNGLNGAPGIPGTSGAPGAQGVMGPAGPPGTPGGDGSGTVGVGTGNVTIGTCDDTVNIRATQTFQDDHFDLGTIVVTNIAGIIGASNGCAGQDATIHVTASGVSKECAITLAKDIKGSDNIITFTTASCSGALKGINMQKLGSNIGLEFTVHGGV
jgi:hypothetical protein